MKTARSYFNNKGFTLIELLVVIGILAILLSIVLIAINPARQFGQANNTRRRSDVTAILNAIGAYAADHKGVLPVGIPVEVVEVPDPQVSQALPICRDTATPANCVDICGDLVTDYIPAVPQDPQTGTGTSIDSAACGAAGDYVTGYEISQDADGRVTIFAPDAENGETISNTR